MKFRASLSTLCVLALTLSGAAAAAAAPPEAEDLTGVWRHYDPVAQEYYTFDLRADGTGVVDGDEPVRWTLKGDRLRVRGEELDETYRVAKKGDALVISEGDLDGPTRFERAGDRPRGEARAGDDAEDADSDTEEDEEGGDAERAVAVAEGGRPEVENAEGLDNELSEADLDASVRMLAFMWEAAGRDVSLVTEEAVADVRAGIARNFASLPPEAQYCFANAQTIYPLLRTTWDAADEGQRTQIAGQFAESLDALGLTDPNAGGGGGGGGGAWDDVNPDDVRAGLIMNTTWNLAQKSVNSN